MTILITAAGGGGTNGLVSTLGEHPYRFIGTNASFYKAAASIIHPTYLIAPASDEVKYINDLNKIIDKHQVELVIPNSDIEVEMMSKHQDSISTKVFVPNYKVCKIANDKFLCYEHCVKNEINVARAISATSIENLRDQLAQFKTYPLWCRIKKGSGSKHTAALKSSEEVLAFIAKKLAQHAELSIEDFIVSDYLPGDDCLIFTIWDNGNLKYMAMAHRQQYFGAQGRSAPTVIKKEYRQDLADLAIYVANSFKVKPHGVYNFDIKYDASGNAALTEINIGRFYYNMPLFNASIDGSPLHIYINTASGNPPQSTLISKDELYFLRDQDNAPVVLTPQALKEKVIKLS